MVGYWRPIRKQAAKETFELVRLDQAGRIVLWVALLAAAGVSALPEWMNALIRVLAVVGATAVVGIGIWIVKMVRIPVRLSKKAEQTEKANLAALRAHNDYLLGEQATAYEAQLAQLRNQLESTTDELNALRNPHPLQRDSTKLYQFGLPVVSIEGAVHIDRATSKIHFERVSYEKTAFNFKAPFEYQEYELRALGNQFDFIGGTGLGMQRNTIINSMIAQILDRRPTR